MTLESIQSAIKEELCYALYFSGQDCGVCSVLEPKITEMITQNFPQIKLQSINAQQFPEIAAHFSVFSVPTFLVFFDSKEFIRKSRNMSVQVLKNEIQRPYSMVTGA